MKLFIYKIIQYIFESLFIAFVLFFVAEYMKTGLVTNYIHYNYLLTLLIIFGIMIVALNQNNGKREEEKHKILRLIGKIFFSAAISFVSVIVIGQNISDMEYLGNISYVSYAVPWVIGFGIFFSIFSILKNK